MKKKYSSSDDESSKIKYKRGPRGKRGRDGLHGYNGHTGQIGPTGPTGQNGTIGIDGSTGPTGPLGISLIEYKKDYVDVLNPLELSPINLNPIQYEIMTSNVNYFNQGDSVMLMGQFKYLNFSELDGDNSTYISLCPTFLVTSESGGSGGSGGSGSSEPVNVVTDTIGFNEVDSLVCSTTMSYFKNSVNMSYIYTIPNDGNFSFSISSYISAGPSDNVLDTIRISNVTLSILKITNSDNYLSYNLSKNKTIIKNKPKK